MSNVFDTMSVLFYNRGVKSILHLIRLKGGSEWKIK